MTFTRLVAGVLLLAVLAGDTLTDPPPSEAAAGCVTNKERRRLRLRQTRAVVHDTIGGTGFYVRTDRVNKISREVRRYRRCGTAPDPRWIEVTYQGGRVWKLDQILLNQAADIDL